MYNSSGNTFYSYCIDLSNARWRRLRLTRIQRRGLRPRAWVTRGQANGPIYDERPTERRGRRRQCVMYSCWQVYVYINPTHLSFCFSYIYSFNTEETVNLLARSLNCVSTKFVWMFLLLLWINKINLNKLKLLLTTLLRNIINITEASNICLISSGATFWRLPSLANYTVQR